MGTWVREGVKVAKVVQRHEGPSPKSLELDKNSKPQHTIFCHNIKICCQLRTFWKSLDKKKFLFSVKNSVFWTRSALLHGIYCLVYRVKFANFQLRAKTTHFVAKIVTTRLTKICLAIFALAEKVPTSATLVDPHSIQVVKLCITSDAPKG